MVREIIERVLHRVAFVVRKIGQLTSLNDRLPSLHLGWSYEWRKRQLEVTELRDVVE